MSLTSEEIWRNKLINDNFDDAKQLYTENLPGGEKTQYIAVIIDLLDVFGKMTAETLLGEDGVAAALKGADESTTPTYLVLVTFVSIWKMVTIGFETSIIQTVSPQGIYIDDYRMPGAVIAASGFQMFELD